MKTILFNPFEKYTAEKLILFGFLLTVIGIILGVSFSARFDGVLDLHFVTTKVNYVNLITDISINILCVTITFLIGAKIINIKTRLIDIIATVVISRSPLYILSVFNINNYMGKISETVLQDNNLNLESNIEFSAFDLTYMVLFGLIAILTSVWHIALLFSGFKTAANAKGTKSIILFITAIVIAEILSKIIFYNIN